MSLNQNSDNVWKPWVKTLFISFVIIAPQIIFFVYLVLSKSIHFITNDDTTMVAIASGAYGNPSEYLINSHIFLGYLTKFLFTKFPIINWLAMIYLFIELMGFIAIDIVFIKKQPKAFMVVFNSAILFCIFTLFITYFTFTTVAFLAGIAGIIWCIDSYTKNNNRFSRSYVVGVVLIIFSIIIRKDAILAIAIFLVPLAVYNFIKFRNSSVLKLIAICIISMSILSFANNHIARKNPIQDSFMNWGAARQKALDSAVIDYDLHKSDFMEIGFSKAAYDAVYNAFYYHKDTFTTDAFTAMSQMNSITERYNFNVLNWMIDQNEQFHKISYMNFYLFLSTIIWMIFLLIAPQNFQRNSILLSSAFMLSILFYVLERNPYRVVMPGFMLATLMILLFSPTEFNLKYELRFNKYMPIILKMNLIITIIGLCLSFTLLNSYRKMGNNIIYDISNRKVLNYLAEHNNQLFLAGGEAATFGIDVSRDIFDFAGKNSKWNLVGNWETYSVPYFELMKYYDIDDPNNIINEIADNDIIRLINPMGEPVPEWVIDLISEKTHQKVKSVCVDTITNTGLGDWNVYAIVSIE